MKGTFRLLASIERIILFFVEEEKITTQIPANLMILTQCI